MANSATATVPRPARIDTNISDLFFNTDLQDAETRDPSDGRFAGYDVAKLREQAEVFLDCLTRLGIDAPTCDDLIADFNARL